MNMIIMERERQEMANLQKKMEINNLESALDTKRNEIAEKRAEELVNTYLKNKQMRVRYYRLKLLIDSICLFGSRLYKKCSPLGTLLF